MAAIYDMTRLSRMGEGFCLAAQGCVGAFQMPTVAYAYGLLCFKVGGFWSHVLWLNHPRRWDRKETPHMTSSLSSNILATIWEIKSGVVEIRAREITTLTQITFVWTASFMMPGRGWICFLQWIMDGGTCFYHVHLQRMSRWLVEWKAFTG